MNIAIRRREVMTLIGGGPGWAVEPGSRASPGSVAPLGGHDWISERCRDATANASFRAGSRENEGWSIGHDVFIDYRFADNDIKEIQRFARELVALNPDCILAHSTRVCGELKQLTQTIPIVFVSVSNPIGSGFVESMARPGGNMTGFTIHRPTITSKHVSILKELMPRIVQVMALYNPVAAPGAGSFFLPSFEEAAGGIQRQTDSGAGQRRERY